jgi:hypothetical protein
MQVVARGGVESRYADFAKIHRREISDLGARGLLAAPR